MKNLIINDENLKIEEIEKFNQKVRAILIDDNNQILVANYGKVILLPGGSIDDNESIFEAIIRELIEETGQNYEREELTYLTCLNYFQKNYPERNGTFKNRLVKTHYFSANFKSIEQSLQKLTNNEKKDNFKLELIPLDSLEKTILENGNDNPRNIYFQKELLTILNFYNDNKKQKGKQKIR